MLTSTWEWIRLLGFLAYFYFTVSIVFGLLRKSTFVKSHKNLIYQVHQNAGWLGLITVVAHMFVLIIDNYQPYALVEVLLPFSSHYQPIASGLGIIAFYLFLLVLLTSDLWLKSMNRSIWKSIHFLVLPAWLLSLLHGILIGSDTDNIYILLFYFTSAGCVLSILIARMVSQGRKTKDKTVPQALRSSK